MQEAVSRLQAQQEATVKREAAVRDLQTQLHHGQGHGSLQLEPSLALVSAATTAPARVVSGSPPLFSQPDSALQKAASQNRGHEGRLDGVQRQGIFNWAGGGGSSVQDGGSSVQEPPTAARAPTPVRPLLRMESKSVEYVLRIFC